MKKFFFIALLALSISSAVAQTFAGQAPQQMQQQSNHNLSINPAPQLLNASSRAWAYNGSGPFQLYSQTLANTTTTAIGTPTTYGFPGAAVWVPTVNLMYVVDQVSPYGLYTVDTTTGVATFIVNCTGVPLGNFCGLTWDQTTGNFYGVGSSISQSQIFTLDVVTGVCSLIGSPTTVCPGAIMLNAAPGGSLFSVDILNDNLYRWDKVTGVPTLIGPLGIDANYGQDGCFDFSDGVYYWAAFNNSSFAPELRTIDTLTGASTIIGTYAGIQTQTLAIRNAPLCVNTTFSQTLAGCPGFSVTVGSTVHSTTGTFTDVLVNAGGCDSTVTTNLTIYSLPTVSANTTASTICAGDPVTLSGSGAVTYTWAATMTVTDNVAFNPTATDTYTVTGTDANGCSNTDMTTVTVNPLPTVVANATATAVCDGTPVTLTGSGATSYTWAATMTVTDNVAFTPTATDTYTVTGTDANGCTNIDMITVTVNPLPSVVANATATTICDGDSVVLTGSGASTYTWAAAMTVTDNVAFAPTATDTYTVTGTDANGCVNTDMITVNVNPVPNVSGTATPSATVCAGSSITLTGNGAVNYTWTGNVTDAVAFVPASSTTYTVTGTDANGCSNTAEVTVTVNALPTVTATIPQASVCVNDGNLTLTGGSPAGGTWSGTNVTGSMFDPTTVGSVTITYSFTDVNGCSATATDNISVDACTGIATISSTNGIVVYPNPNAGQFTIQLAATPNDAVQVEVTNALGQVVNAFTMSDTTAEVNISTLENGVYFIRVINGDVVTVQRVVKQ
jgi:hypothetical protein